MSQSAKGAIAMIVAAAVWGFSPLYYDLLVHVPPAEILAHRTLWSVVIFSAVIALSGRVSETRRVLGSGRVVGWIAVSSPS